MLKLGTMVTDKVTEIKGMLIMYNVDMTGNINYLFQPAGLNPEDYQPLDSFWIGESRIQKGVNTQVKLPLEVLGSAVEDTASGFKGTAISLSYHLNGCIHVDVKAKGTIKKTGETIKPCNLDIRRLKGKMIKPLTEKELEQSKVDAPSPEPMPSMDKR